MLMKNEQRQDCLNGEFTLSAEELQLALSAIGDRADALLEKAAKGRDDAALDAAWAHINLYNKICAHTSVQLLRSAPRTRGQRRPSQRASSRF